MRKLTAILFLCLMPLWASAETVKAYDPADLTSTLFTDITRDTKGYLWIATEYGLNKFDGATFTHYYSDNGEPGELVSNKISRLRVKNDTLWVFFYDAVQYYNPTTDNFVTVVSEDNEAVQRLLGPVEKKNYTAISQQLGKKVTALYKDEYGHQWVGCFQNTLYRITDEDEAATYILMDKPWNNGHALYTVLQDKDGAIYACQTKNGMQRIDEQGNAIGARILPGKTISCLLEASDGYTYIGAAEDGIYRCKRANGTLIPNSHIVSSGNKIKSLVQDLDGTIYVSSMGGGVGKINPQKTSIESINGFESTNRYVDKLVLDHQGRLWACNYSGIDIFNTRSQQMEYELCRAAREVTQWNTIVYDLLIDSAVVYMATSRGLFVFDGRWTRYTMSDGLPSNLICRVIRDKAGDIWLSTFHGLSRFAPHQANANQSPASFTNYFRGNGLEAVSYTRSAGFVHTDGRLIFPDNNGITFLSPKRMSGKPFTQPVVLSRLYVNNTPVHANVDEQELIRISYLDNMFTMQFATLDMRDADNVCYEYRFAGADDHIWHSTLPGEHSLTFNHLAYGRHTLQVRAHEGNEYSSIRQFSIEIIPPFYLSGWAWIVYMLLFIAFVLLALRLYQRKVGRNMREKQLQFYVDMAHELRSPLTLIKSPVDKLLAGNEIRDITRRELIIVQQNTKRLLDMASEILSLDKIQRGKKELHCTNCNVADWLPNMVGAYKPLADDKHIALSVVGAEQAPVCAFSVSDIEKVINNFITNALKFTPEGGEITVGCDTVENQLHLWVADTGKGINEDETKKLFELFYQSKNTVSDHHKGFGVGLNLSYRIMQMHGGSIAAHNRTDKQGAVFEIFLPLQTIEEPQQSPITSNQSPITNHKYTLFVVDDDESIRQYLIKELGESYTVETYPDGEACWQQLLLHLPDLLISDVRMPKLDGFDLLVRIRKNAETTALPVILLTTETDSASRIEGLQHGADQYIDKPFNMEELKATVASLLSNREKMRGKYSGQREGGGLVEQRTIDNPDDQLMERVAKVVNNRLDDSELSVEVLAAEVGMSRAQLQRKLKELTGTSVGNYIREIRLKQAAEMLKQPNINVAQIGYTVGFTAPNIFSTAFKKYFGVTPVQYREMAMSDSQKTKSE